MTSFSVRRKSISRTLIGRISRVNYIGFHRGTANDLLEADIHYLTNGKARKAHFAYFSSRRLNFAVSTPVLEILSKVMRNVTYRILPCTVATPRSKST